MFLYNVKSAYPQGRYHEINRNIDITKDIGAEVNSYIPYICIGETDTKYAREFYNKINLRNNGLICVHPGASREIRAWGREKFTEVIRRLIDKYNVTVILTWGPEEKLLVENIAGELGPHCTIAPETKTIGQLAAIIKESDMFISNCTGPMNVAVAVDTNVVAILGSSDPLDWGPYGSKHRIIKSPLRLDSYSDEDEERAMDQIDISSVWEIVQKRWLEINSRISATN
jgi:ADP-heptose:LPS heptosyltransferase